MLDEIVFPDPTKKYVRTLRFANLLDDAHNAISWTKVHVLFANIAGAANMFGLLFAWFGSHLSMLDHAMSVAPITAGYLTHAHAMHLMDKGQRNKHEVEDAKVVKQ
ncbi:MAG: hypothetical protein RB191_12500 [Terriglobia bacterium]|nr:hypothetical protein [Terriglobia bacterium]